MKKKDELLRKLHASLEHHAVPPGRRVNTAVPEPLTVPEPAGNVAPPEPIPLAPPPASAPPPVAAATAPAETIRADRRLRAEAVVRRYVGWSAGAGAIPLPLVDFAALTLVQLRMLREIADAYGIAFCEVRARALAGALTGGLASSTLAAGGLASAAKTVPGIGLFLGGAAGATLGGASAYAVGHVFIEHFETGGTLLDFQPESMRHFFAAKFTEGRTVVRELGRRAFHPFRG